MIWLGTLGGNRSEAWDVSADGSVVVGVARNAAGQDRAFRWTRATGMVDLGTLGGNYSAAYGVSADGSVVVGHAHGAAGQWRAFRWVLTNPATGAGTMYEILGLQYRGHPDSVARGVSADGRVVVGTVSYHYGFYWVLVNPATGWGMMTNLGYPTHAYAVSADGSVVVGYGENGAFRWTAETGMQYLAKIVCRYNTNRATRVRKSTNEREPPPQGSPCEQGEPNGRAARFPSRSGGNLQEGGNYELWLGDWYNTHAYGVSADGSVVVGYVYSGQGDARAVRWKRAGGDDLNITYDELLTNGSRLISANAVSSNGRYIVGFGYNAATRREEAFLLDTGVSRCLDSDVNGDGVVDDADLLQVLFDFGSSCN